LLLRGQDVWKRPLNQKSQDTMKLAMLPLMTATAFFGSSPFTSTELAGVSAMALLGATLLIAGATHRRQPVTPPALAARAAAVGAAAPSFFTPPAPVAPVPASSAEKSASATIIPFPGFGRGPIAANDTDGAMPAEIEARLEADLTARAARICGRYNHVLEGQHETQSIRS
jgi:hypothetical protein